MPMTTRDPARRTAAMVVGLLVSLGSAGVTMQPHRVLAQAETETQVNVELIMDSSGFDGRGDRHRRTADRRRQARAQPGDRRDPGRPPGDQRRVPCLRPRRQQHRGRRAESCQSSDLTVPIEGVDKDALARAGRQLHAGRVDADRPLARARRGRLSRRIGHGDQRDHPRHRRSRDLRRRPVRDRHGAQGERRGGHGVRRRSRTRRGRAADHQLHRRQHAAAASSARRTPTSCRRHCSRSSRSWRSSSPPASSRSSRSAGSTRWRR